MRQAEDIILRDFLLSAASVYNARGGVNGDSPTEWTIRDSSSVASSLDTANAFKFLTGKQGEDRYGSAPVRAAYFFLCSTEMQPTFDAIDKFTSSWNYPNQNDVIYSEYGALLNLRIFTSSESAVQRNASAINGADVFNNMLIARESYGHIDQDGYSSQLIYRPPIFSGPLALNGTLGVKFAQSQAILQETWLRNCRCTLAA
jgi:N4-gp56 family major capsid protein